MNEIIVNSRDLAQGLGAVIHAASTDPMRPVLHGVLFEGRQGKLRLVAADNYRIAYAEIEADALSEAPLILPLDVASTLLKDCKATKMPDRVTITFDETGATIAFGFGVTRNVRVAQGPFPNYVQVIPVDREHDRTIGLSARQLADLSALTDSSIRHQHSTDTALRVTFGGPLDLIIVRGEYGTEVLMPVRLS